LLLVFKTCGFVVVVAQATLDYERYFSPEMLRQNISRFIAF
jgi:hypothetical protein